MSASSAIVKPIASPAICLKVPRGSTAVAKTTQTRKNVSTASIATPLPELMPVPRSGAPRWEPLRAFAGSTQRRRSAASVAATSCTTR